MVLRLAGSIGLSLLVASRASAGCPTAAELERDVRAIDLARASRMARFAAPLPSDLYGAALRRVGRAVAARDGDRAFGVLVAERPIEPLWKALNDEDHHAIVGDYIPVRTSEVIDGTPRGASRLLLQSFQEVGVGRWWASQVWMNRELYVSTHGRMWELVWEDRMADVDRTRPKVQEIAAKLTPIERSRGSWLLVPVAPSCTLVEHFTWTDPGGFVGATQWLLAKKVVRDTVEGLVRLADEHIATTPHPGPPFIRPDGTPLE